MLAASPAARPDRDRRAASAGLATAIAGCGRATDRPRPTTRPAPAADPGRGRPARAADDPPVHRAARADRGVRGHADPRQGLRLRARSGTWTSATKVKKGQVLAVLERPRARRRGRAEAGHGRGGRGQARPGEGRRRRWPRPTSPAPRPSWRRSGPASSGPRPTSPAGRPSSSASSSSSTSGRRPAACSTRPGASSGRPSRPREEVDAQVKTAEAAVLQSRAMLDKARADVTAAAASIKVARSDARRVRGPASTTPRSSPPTTASSPARNVDVGDLTEPGTPGRAPVHRRPRRRRADRRERARDVRHRGRARATARSIRLQALAGTGLRGQGHADVLDARRQEPDAPHRDRRPEPRGHAPPGPLRLRHHHRRGARRRPDRAHHGPGPAGGPSLTASSSADGQGRAEAGRRRAWTTARGPRSSPASRATRRSSRPYAASLVGRTARRGDRAGTRPRRETVTIVPVCARFISRP